MRYSEIISESRAESASLDLMKEECAGTLMNYERGAVQLYRGFHTKRNESFFSINPANHPPREPAYFKVNYYKEFFDKLPSWNGVDSRAKAIIGSTDMHRASGYDYERISYVVIPIDSAFVYECPTEDFWQIRINGYRSLSETLLNLFETHKKPLYQHLNDKENGFEFWNNAFAPDTIGITKHQASSMTLSLGHECWTGQKCYFMPSRDFYDEFRF